MNAATTCVKRWGAQDSLWLCLAIALHACLLLIPALQKDHTIARTGPLNITLHSPRPIEKPFVEEAETRQTVLPAIKTIAPEEPPEPELAHLEQAEHQADQSLDFITALANSTTNWHLSPMKEPNTLQPRDAFAGLFGNWQRLRLAYKLQRACRSDWHKSCINIIG